MWAGNEGGRGGGSFIDQKESEFLVFEQKVRRKFKLNDSEFSDDIIKVLKEVWANYSTESEQFAEVASRMDLSEYELTSDEFLVEALRIKQGKKLMAYLDSEDAQWTDENVDKICKHAQTLVCTTTQPGKDAAERAKHLYGALPKISKTIADQLDFDTSEGTRHGGVNTMKKSQLRFEEAFVKLSLAIIHPIVAQLTCISDVRDFLSNNSDFLDTLIMQREKIKLQGEESPVPRTPLPMLEWKKRRSETKEEKPAGRMFEYATLRGKTSEDCLAILDRERTDESVAQATKEPVERSISKETIQEESATSTPISRETIIIGETLLPPSSKKETLLPPAIKEDKPAVAFQETDLPSKDDLALASPLQVSSMGVSSSAASAGAVSLPSVFGLNPSITANPSSGVHPLAPNQIQRSVFHPAFNPSSVFPMIPSNSVADPVMQVLMQMQTQMMQMAVSRCSQGNVPSLGDINSNVDSQFHSNGGDEDLCEHHHNENGEQVEANNLREDGAKDGVRGSDVTMDEEMAGNATEEEELTQCGQMDTTNGDHNSENHHANKSNTNAAPAGSQSGAAASFCNSTKKRPRDDPESDDESVSAASSYVNPNVDDDEEGSQHCGEAASDSDIEDHIGEGEPMASTYWSVVTYPEFIHNRLRLHETTSAKQAYASLKELLAGDKKAHDSTEAMALRPLKKCLAKYIYTKDTQFVIDAIYRMWSHLSEAGTLPAVGERSGTLVEMDLYSEDFMGCVLAPWFSRSTGAYEMAYLIPKLTKELETNYGVKVGNFELLAEFFEGLNASMPVISSKPYLSVFATQLLIMADEGYCSNSGFKEEFRMAFCREISNWDFDFCEEVLAYVSIPPTTPRQTEAIHMLIDIGTNISFDELDKLLPKVKKNFHETKKAKTPKRAKTVPAGAESQAEDFRDCLGPMRMKIIMSLASLLVELIPAEVAADTTVDSNPDPTQYKFTADYSSKCIRYEAALKKFKGNVGKTYDCNSHHVKEVLGYNGHLERIKKELFDYLVPTKMQKFIYKKCDSIVTKEGRLKYLTKNTKASHLIPLSPEFFNRHR